MTILLIYENLCQGLDPKLTKAHLPKFPALEDELHKWVKDVSANNPQERPPVSMAAVLEKAQETAVMKGETHVCVCNLGNTLKSLVCAHFACMYLRFHQMLQSNTHICMFRRDGL